MVIPWGQDVLKNPLFCENQSIWFVPSRISVLFIISLLLTELQANSKNKYFQSQVLSYQMPICTLNNCNIMMLLVLYGRCEWIISSLLKMLSVYMRGSNVKTDFLVHLYLKLAYWKKKQWFILMIGLHWYTCTWCFIFLKCGFRLLLLG